MVSGACAATGVADGWMVGFARVPAGRAQPESSKSSAAIATAPKLLPFTTSERTDAIGSLSVADRLFS
jgi:hypothetical protein